MKTKRILYDLSLITVGAAALAFSVSGFFDPFHIVPGGVTGIAMLICAMIPALPLGVTVLLLNVPLFALSWRLYGNRFLVYTAFGTFISGILIDVFSLLPKLDMEPLLAGLAGGVIMGFGLGLVFGRGATTGGSDIIARLLKSLFPHVQMGRLMLVFDGGVVLLSGLLFQSLNHMLYAAAALYVSARVMDGLLYGMNIERVAYIISDHSDDIVNAIFDQMGRGATLLHGEGAFSGASKRIILCAVKRQQVVRLKQLCRDIDPKAFLILSEANEVLGEGFDPFRTGKDSEW